MGVWLFLYYYIFPHLPAYVRHPESLIYNVPISFVFAFLAWDLIFATFQRPFVRSIKAQSPFIIVWLAGFVLLYLRLIAQSVEVSGHMAWYVLMLAQSLIRKLPGWFITLLLLSFAKDLYIKFTYQGHGGGVNGLLVGAGLGLVLWLLTKNWENDK